ncbi:MAG: menaquinone biosynthesis protein [Candidatus Dadabacteria bacterium]|nr:menaquinone biosynthesis protein [Candidatus Dadabacteria bacterium]MYB26186.1 menaquinone biosynthesis protein [Candidatus Dadabacteria bacterium]
MNEKKGGHPLINLGAAPFLNMRPLIYPLEKGLVEHSFNIMYFDPFLLSGNLSEGVIDVAPIPSVEFLRTDDYCILPDISISSFGKVDSVILKARKEITKITSVSVDSRSKSSTALLRIVLELFLGLTPEYVKRSPGNVFLEEVDAGMLIGNAGLGSRHLCRDNSLLTYDLGELWTEETALPFVYALMATRKGDGATAEACRCLVSTRDKGVGLIREIADIESRKLGLSREQCETYLQHRIKYDLDDAKVEGLTRYRDLLFELGEIEKKNEMDFHAALS